MTEPRPPLSRSRIIAAAIAIADRDGVAAASMRRIADSLNVEAMSLYRHIESRDGLLDGLVDQVVAEVPLPEPGRPWRDTLHDRAVALRRLCLRHRWAASLIEARLAPGPARLMLQESGLATLRAAGFPVAMACSGLRAVDSYVYGFCLHEAALPFDLDKLPQVISGLMAAVPPDRYPCLAEAMACNLNPDRPPLVAGAADVADDEFLFGLGRLLDGLAVVMPPTGR